MKTIISGLAAGFVGFAAAISFASGPAAAGGVLDTLRSKGLGKWVDQYVQEDASGDIKLKPSKRKLSLNNANANGNSNSISGVLNSYGIKSNGN